MTVSQQSSEVQTPRELADILLPAYDAISHGVTLTDSWQTDNPLVYVNAGFAALTGYDRSEIVGRNCRFLQGADTDQGIVAEMEGAIASATAFAGIIRNYRKDGSPFWNEITIRPIENGAEPGRYFVGVQIDATARLRLEERLREAQKMEALGKLAGGVAHDFNNLLALTLVNAELITQECGDLVPVREAANDIADAAEAGSALIKRMLDFSRGQVPVVERLNVNRLIGKTVDLLRRTLREPIQIEIDLADEEIAVQADAASFETALINLALNSRDAMPSGGRIVVRTRLRADSLVPGRTAVAILVSDTGCGMDQAAIDRAFEPYYTTKGPERGTGLGLPMVYSFANQSGGRIAISSEVGEGTTVELLLPLADERGGESTMEKNSSGRRILLVEDEEKLRRTLALRLRRAGYVVEHGSTVAEAVDLLRAHPAFDVIVSDIRLPGGASGLDLLRRVRSGGGTGGFLLMTGFSDELDGETDLGDVEILRKPFRLAEFIESIEAAIPAERRPPADALGL